MDREKSGGGAEEEWSWTDSDEDDAAMDGSIPDPSGIESLSTRIGLPVKSRSLSMDEDVNRSHRATPRDVPGMSQPPRSYGGAKSLQAKVRDMVAQGLCSNQAADMFLKLEAEAGGHEDSAVQKKLQATTSRLQQSEDAQLRLQAEVMRLSLQPRNDGDSGAGVTAFDVARAQREAEKVLILQRKVSEAEENERQQSVVNSKMEELLRLQEDALHDREESVAKLEKELEDAKGAAIKAIAQLEESERRQKEIEAKALDAVSKMETLEEALVERDEKLRNNDQESLSIYEARLEEKEAQLSQCEARLAAQGGDNIGPLKRVIEDTRQELEAREAKIQSLSSELFQLKLSRDQEQMKAESLSTATRDLRAEVEQTTLALSIVEPKLHVLQSMMNDIQANVSRRDSNFQSQKDRLGRSAQDHEARGRFFHGQVEELKKAIHQREQKIQALQGELDRLRSATAEKEGMEEILLEARQREMLLQDEVNKKEARLQTLQASLDQMAYAMDRTQGQLGERETRLHLLQSAFDQSQPAMAIARKAVEERDMKLDAFQVLLRLGEGQVQDNLRALEEAHVSIKDKEETISQQLSLIQDQAERLRHFEQLLETKSRESAAWEARMNLVEQQQLELQARAAEYKRLLEQIEKREFTAGSVYENVEVTPASELPSTEDKELLPEDHVLVGGVPLSAVRSMGFGEMRNVSARAVVTLPRMAHQPLENAAEHHGAIALIERGECSFLEKAVRAQEAGAAGVVFINSDDQLYQPVSLPGAQNHGLCSLPVMCVRKSDGGKLLLPGAEVTLAFGPPVDAARPSSSPPLGQYGRDGAASPSDMGHPQAAADTMGPALARPAVTFSDQQPPPPTLHSAPAPNYGALVNSVPWAPAIQAKVPGQMGALPATGPLGAHNAKRVVAAGAELIEQRRGRLTGSLMRQELFFRVLPPGLLQWRGRSARILAVLDGAGPDVNQILMDPHEATRSFRIRVARNAADEDGGDANSWDVEVMANSPDEKNLWLEGAAQFTHSGEERSVGGGVQWHSYNGQLLHGLPHGRGVAVWGNGDQFMGEWEGGLLHGSGIFEWGNGDVYTGQWREGMRHGHGILAGGDGTMYQGEWASHRKHGRGVEAQSNGDKYSGSWVGGAKNGLGIWSYSDGNRRAVDCRGGAEVWSGSYPQPDEVTQKRLLVSLDNARASAQAAAQAAGHAQTVCQQLEHHLVSSASKAPPQGLGPQPGLAVPAVSGATRDVASTWAARRAQQQAVAASLPVMAASAAGDKAVQRLLSAGSSHQAQGGRLVAATTQDGAVTRMQPPPPAAADIVMASLAGAAGEAPVTSVTPVAVYSQQAPDFGGGVGLSFASHASASAGAAAAGRTPTPPGAQQMGFASSFATTRSPGHTASPPHVMGRP